jgi:RNA polymerase sigma-70 factor (ECF subfamily)
MAWLLSRPAEPVQKGHGIAEYHAEPAEMPGVEPDDGALIAAARADPRAFTPLYERYVDRVYRYCYLQLGNHAAAEDATSEVFLKALAGLGGFRGGNVAAWILRIARNAVIDTYRRRRPSASIDAVSELADPAPTPEGAALAGAEQQALREALAALPDDQRAAVALQLAGWSGEQIAAALDRSPAAVYMLRTRALARMAKSLRRAGWHPEESRHDQP